MHNNDFRWFQAKGNSLTLIVKLLLSSDIICNLIKCTKYICFISPPEYLTKCGDLFGNQEPYDKIRIVQFFF